MQYSVLYEYLYIHSSFSEMYKINKVLLTIIFKQKLMPVILGH